MIWSARCLWVTPVLQGPSTPHSPNKAHRTPTNQPGLSLPCLPFLMETLTLTSIDPNTQRCGGSGANPHLPRWVRSQSGVKGVRKGIECLRFPLGEHGSGVCTSQPPDPTHRQHAPPTQARLPGQPQSPLRAGLKLLLSLLLLLTSLSPSISYQPSVDQSHQKLRLTQIGRLLARKHLSLGENKHLDLERKNI